MTFGSRKFMPDPGTHIRRDRMEYEVDRNGSWRRVWERTSKKSREIKRKRGAQARKED